MTKRNWLFLRGLVREQAHWGDFPRLFETQNPGAKVFCLDLPGTGTERSRPSPWTVGEITDDVRARWLSLRAQSDGPWSLLTISLGSMVGFDWVHRHSSDFDHLVVINTSLASLSKPWERLDLKSSKELIRVLRSRDEAVREAAIVGLTTNIHRDDPELIARWTQIARDRPVRFQDLLRQLAAASVFQAPASLETPLLVLSSSADRLVNQVCSQRIAEFFKAQHAVHDRAGHDISVDDPKWVTEQVTQWIPRESV